MGIVKYVVCMTVTLYKYIVPFRFDLFRLPKDVSIFETELQYFAQFDLNLQTQYEDPTTEPESVENFNECVNCLEQLQAVKI